MYSTMDIQLSCRFLQLSETSHEDKTTSVRESVQKTPRIIMILENGLPDSALKRKYPTVGILRVISAIPDTQAGIRNVYLCFKCVYI